MFDAAEEAVTLLTTYQGQVVVIGGDHFPERSILLNRWVTLCKNQGHRAIYLGSNVQKYFSLLGSDIYEELSLHTRKTQHEKFVFSLIESFGLVQCLRQSPFTLSSGEQILFVTLCALSSEPFLLVLDDILDPLDQINKARLTHIFSSPLVKKTTLLVTEDGYTKDIARNFSLRCSIAESGVTAKTVSSFSASNYQFVPAEKNGRLGVQEVYFSYTGQCAILRGASFHLEPGRVYSLEGKNGAGKSTLGQILAGALPIYQGSISFADHTIRPWESPGKIAVMHMQDPDKQLFSNSVRQELSDLPEFSFWSAVALAGVEDLLDQHPLDLPFVLRKRLTFSIVAHLRRPWFIFDEPILGQDLHSCDQMAVILRCMAKNGAGIIVISHSHEFIRRLYASRLRLDDGIVNEI